MDDDDPIDETARKLRSWAAGLDVNTAAFSSWTSMKGMNTVLDSALPSALEAMATRYPNLPGAPFHIFACSPMALIGENDTPVQIEVILFRLTETLPLIRVTWVRGQEGDDPIDIMVDPDDELSRVVKLCLSVIPRGIPLPELTDYQMVGFYSNALGGVELSPN